MLLLLRRSPLLLLLLLLLLRTVSSQHLHPKYSTAPYNLHKLNLHKGRRRLPASNSWSWPPWWATNWEQRASCSCLNCNNYYNWQRRRPKRKIVHQRHRVRCWVPLPLPLPLLRANNIRSRRTCRKIKFHHIKQRHLLVLMLALTPPHKLLVAWCSIMPNNNHLSIKTFNRKISAVLMMASSAQRQYRKVTTVPMETNLIIKQLLMSLLCSPAPPPIISTTPILITRSAASRHPFRSAGAVGTKNC